MKRRFVLGITGGSGSGKSWLAGYLRRGFGRGATVLCQDWYYRDHAHLSPEKARKLNFDHPRAIDNTLLLRHLDRLMRGQPVQAPIYDYVTHARLKYVRPVQPAPLIIVEGLFVLLNPRLRKQLNDSVFIDVPDDVRLIRRIRRDVEQRHVDLEETLRLYEHCVRPMHLLHIQPAATLARRRWKQLEDRSFPHRILEELKAAVLS